jgi:hypothetical protein
MTTGKTYIGRTYFESIILSFVAVNPWIAASNQQ